MKSQMVAFLENQTDAQAAQRHPHRTARVQVLVGEAARKPELYEITVDLEENKVTQQEHLEGKHPYIDATYMQEVEKACLADTRVQKEIQELQLPSGASVCAEPWAYATDGMHDMSKRTTMVWKIPV